MNNIKNFNQFINESTDNISFSRNNCGVDAYLNGEIVGGISLYDYWTESQYIDDKEILDEIEIPEDYEFVGMIQSDIQGKGIATNMIKYAIETTQKKGIAVSKLFIADEAIHSIMKKLNAESIPDWYILNKK